jgi:hypothetical protein
LGNRRLYPEADANSLRSCLAAAVGAAHRGRSVARAAGVGGGWYPRVAVWLGGWRGMALVPGVGGMRSAARRPGSGALYPGRDVLPPPNNALEPTAPMVACTHSASLVARRLTAGVRVCRDKPARCEGVQVSDSEGLANHTGPESCASFGNGVREALTGECAGRVLSPEIGLFLGADALLTRGRQQWGHRYGKAPPAPGGVEDPWHARKHCVRDPGGPAPGLGHRTQARTANPEGTRP